jgi:hypothetical protein
VKIQPQWVVTPGKQRYKHFIKGDYKHMVSDQSYIKLSCLEYQLGKEAIQIRVAIHEMNTAYF